MGFSISRGLIVLGAAGMGVAALAAGCATQSQGGGAGAGTQPAAAQPLAGTTGKSGQQLWAENCGRCHNIRSPSSYGPAQWEVAVHDMRVRANLTGEEQRKITEFLKSASQ